MNFQVWIGEVIIKAVAILCNKVDSAHFHSLPVCLWYTLALYTN